jgi:amidohydrolase
MLRQSFAPDNIMKRSGLHGARTALSARANVGPLGGPGCPRSAGLAILLLCLPAPLFAADASPSRADKIAEAAEALRPILVQTRRDFHMHPELSNQEERTARVVAEKLRALGFDEIRTNVAGHGVVALLKGAQPGAVVAVRADMDALPINETMDVPYKSLVPGVKHACGHDAHTAIALGVAELLSKMHREIHGSVKFLFQPAEEAPPGDKPLGAALMIQEGTLENPRPSAIFGLHTTTEIDAGKIGYRAGAAQASSDSFVITIHGKMAHAADPHNGIDTIVVAAECVTALQTIKSRRVDAFEPVILTIGTIHGGNRPNIMPDEVKMEGTVRTFNETVRQQVEQMMRETLGGVTAAYGAKFDLEYRHGTMVVFNDPKLVAASLPSIRRAVGETNVIEAPKRMGAEDFSFYEQVVPGFFLRLGSGNKAKGIVAEAHTPEFDIDEDCLVTGVKVMSNLVLDYLHSWQRNP